MTKDKVLRFIGAGCDKGRSFGEIQRFIVEGNGLNYDEFEKTSWSGHWRRRYRGYWCVNLCGSMYTGPGILQTYCYKNGMGRYVLREAVRRHARLCQVCGIGIPFMLQDCEPCKKAQPMYSELHKFAA